MIRSLVAAALAAAAVDVVPPHAQVPRLRDAAGRLLARIPSPGATEEGR